MNRLRQRSEPCDAERPPQAAPDPAALLPPVPIVFDTFSGIFQPTTARHRSPVLMLSAVGYEELCSRAFFGALADALARNGIASLRFDYPGTADALDGPISGLDDWRSATRLAASRLRQLTGHDEVAVLGQGLGASFALAWATDLGAVGAVALLEPPASGRAYLRGLKAWGAVIAAARGLAPDPCEEGAISVAGLVLPPERAAAIATLEADLSDGPIHAPVLLLSRSVGGGRPHPLTRRKESLGSEITEADFVGYDALLTDPTSAVVPDAAVATVAEWLASRRPRLAAAPVGRLPPPTELQGDGFIERPLRFGTNGRLAGVLCRPAEGTARRAVVLVTAGRDYRIGWGRSAVLQARALAQAGVSSLRFDISGVGDSRVPEGFEGEVLFSQLQSADLGAAIDALAATGFRSVGLVGRCSGAWAAFTAAAEDYRVDSLVLLNTAYFIWDPSKNLAEVIRFAQRTVGDLGTTFLRREGLRRLVAGELDVGGALRFLGREANRRFVRPCAHLLGRLTPDARRFHDLHAMLSSFEARRVRTRLIYSQGDTSLLELRSLMGSRLGRLRRYPSISFCEIDNADHNFTTRAARDRVRDELVSFFAAGADQVAANARGGGGAF